MPDVENYTIVVPAPEWLRPDPWLMRLADHWEVVAAIADEWMAAPWDWPSYTPESAGARA